MNYHHAHWAAKGHRSHHEGRNDQEGREFYQGRQSHEGRQFHEGRGRERHLQARSMDRAAVNIYRTDNSYEMLVFAPGRIREHFNLEVRGSELLISYAPPDNFPRPDWVHREYSRGGFVRSFTLDETVDAGQIQAKYVDGVLQVTLPVVAGKEQVSQTIPIS